MISSLVDHAKRKRKYHVFPLLYLLLLSYSLINLNNFVLFDMEKWEKYTVPQLKSICDEKGIVYGSQEKKAQIIERILHYKGEISVEEISQVTEDESETAKSDKASAELDPPSKGLSFEERKALLILESELRQREQRLHFELKQEELKLQNELQARSEANKTSTAYVLKIRDMRENEDVEEYFQLFEKAALAMHVPKSMWVGNLSYHLNDKCRSVYLELSEDEMSDFEKVREKILQAYQLTSEHYRCQFRASQKKPDGDFLLWARRTRRYLDKWMCTAKANEKEQILEQIAIEQLITSVSTELQIWLKDKQIQSTSEFGQLANEFVQARKGPIIDGKYVGKKSTVNPAKRTGEPKKNTSKEIECYNCSEKGHYASSCPLSKAKQTDTKPGIKCFNCSDFGHYASNCPKPDRRSTKKVEDEKGLLCLQPLENKFAPDFSFIGKINGERSRMLVDSGCSRTLVHRKFVSKDMETGQFISVLLADGSALEIPLAKVSIRTGDGKEFNELVGVVDRLPTDCLLGRSSYGKSLTQDDIMAHWSNNANLDGVEEIDEALVVTRRQAILEAAQKRNEEIFDRENEIAQRNVSKPRTVDNSDNSICASELNVLFQDSNVDSLVEDSENDKIVHEEPTNGKVEIVHEEPKVEKELIEEPNCSETTPEEYVNILLRDKTQIIADQQKDPSLRPYLKQYEPLYDSDGYFLKDGLLMHRKYFKGKSNLELFYDRVVVPQFLRQEIMRIAHSIPVAGHMGIGKTQARIENHFFWPGFYSDIRVFCQTCPQCQLVARKRTQERAPLKPVPIVSVPFTKIAMDLIGELPRTKSGYKYILTLVDYATRYPEAIPLKTSYSREICDALITIFARVGIPEELITDQGQNLIGKLMSQLYEHFGIRKLKTSPYHPEANGLVERFNGTLKAMLRKLSHDVQNWDKYIPYLLFAYREVPQASTGYSPFELLYGRPVRGPLAVVKDSWTEEKSEDQNLTKYVLDMRQRMKATQEIVKQNLQSSQLRQKTLFDRKSSEKEFHVGDKVIILLPTPGSKLETKWQGPFEVTEVSDDLRNIKVDTKKKVKRYRVYNIGLVRKWKDRLDNGEFAFVTLEPGCLDQFENYSYRTSKEDWKDVQINPELNDNQRDTLEALLQEFSDLFSEHPNRTSVCEHVIDTGEAEPFRSTSYRVPKGFEKAYYEEVDYMLNLGIIRPSKSPWASPVVIVPKPDGKIRFCIDYRKLNKISKMDAFPMPRPEEMIERVAKSSYISTLDLTKGYWQIPMHVDSIEKTAFITPRGLYEFLVMPFGLKTAPATFQRMVKTKILTEFEEVSDAYIDDIEVDTEDFSNHVIYLRKVFQRLRKFNLVLRPSKCKLAFPKVDYIGFFIGSNTISPRSVLVKSIEDFPRPTTKKELRSFLGLVGYYRRHIKKFSEYAAPLTDLTRGKGSQIDWNPACEQSFQFFQTALSSYPVLVPPDWRKPFFVQVDASNRGVGAVLAQVDKLGEEHPICYISRKLTRTEEILSTTEKECLALFWAITKLRYYLFGRKFFVQVDHNPLVWLNRVKEKSLKLLRWSLTLQEYDFEVLYKPGKSHTNADALSRV